MKLWSIAVLLICICGCDVNPAERNNVGNELYNQGQYDTALAAYQAAQVSLPDGPVAYYNAGSTYAQIREFDKAVAAFLQALKTADSDLKIKAYYNLGNIYFQMHNFDEAVEAYQQVLLINPNDTDARYNLELAIKRLVVPSPTPISPTEQPTDNGSNSATPTADFSSQLNIMASETSDASTSQLENLPSTSNANELPATISVNDAESILDAVQQAQQSLPNQSLSGTPLAENSGKDW
jgi:Ca-activated chloride channel homolog